MQTIEDFELPKANILKVIKSVLPDYKVQKEAQSAMSRACTVFINYLAAAANDVTKKAGRKSITTSDVTRALQVLELDEILLEKVAHAIQTHQSMNKEKRLDSKKKRESSHLEQEPSKKLKE